MAELRKDLTLFDLTMIAVGSVIGSGIFLTPSSIARALPSPFWILLVWVLGGVLALTGALTFSELSGMMPRAGGLYVFLSEAYGKVFGFLYGWIILWVVNTGGIAAVSIAFATYFGHFVPLDETGVKITAISGLVLLTALNIHGVKSGAVFSDLFTVLKILGIAGLILLGLGWGGGGKTDYAAPLGDLPGGLLSALVVAMVGVIWSCGGWQHATFAAGEARNAKRTVSLAMIIGAVAITVIYLLTNVAYLQVLSPAEIAASERVAADAAQAILGPLGGDLIALCIFISTFGTAGIYTLTAPRIYYAMAENGVFFRRIAAVHPRFRTPLHAILLQSAWSIVLILFWRTFDNLISYVVFMDAVFFAMAATSLFVFRRRFPRAERPYRTPGYPIVPLIFIAIMTGFVVNLVAERPVQSLAGLGFTLLGLPVYALLFRRPG